MTRSYTIVDEIGLHARPASLLVQQANKYPMEIWISYGDHTVTLKSIMATMSLGVPQGGVVEITVDAEDAAGVFADLERVLVANKLI
jgi:phosphocarrier protein